MTDELEEGEVQVGVEAECNNDDDDGDYFYGPSFVKRSRAHGGCSRNSAPQENILQDTWCFRAILPVAMMDESFDPSQEPGSGEEYLRLVRYEMDLLPKAKVSPVDLQVSAEAPRPDQEYQQLQTWITETPRLLHPQPEWMDTFLEAFRLGCTQFHHSEGDLDSFHSKIPSYGDMVSWKRLFYPESCPVPKLEVEVEVEQSSGSQANETVHGETETSIEVEEALLDQIPQRQIIQLLEFHAKWMHESSTITEKEYCWIVRLLQNLDPRLTSRQLSSLRRLTRCLVQMRHSLPPEASNGSLLFYLNGIITIVAKVFGQSDLLLNTGQVPV